MLGALKLNANGLLARTKISQCNYVINSFRCQLKIFLFATIWHNVSRYVMIMPNINLLFYLLAYLFTMD